MTISTVHLGASDPSGVFVLQRGTDDIPWCYLITTPRQEKTSPDRRIPTGSGRITPHAERGYDRLYTGEHPKVRISYRLKQIHSKRVIRVPEQYRSGLTGDGLVTDTYASVLSVGVADCLPIYLYIPATPHFAIVHSGWKGTGIVSSAIDSLLRASGRSVDEVRAIIGPGIGACCYEVPVERAALFPATSRRTVEDRVYLDLRQANIELMRRRGIGSVSVCETCTSCDIRLHSYRRESPETYTIMTAAIGYVEL